MITNELNDRRAAAAGLLIDRENLPVITGLSSPTSDVMAAGDHDNNFYLWAAMGSAATIGLGIQPDRSVLVVTGDGEMMMALGTLVTIKAEGGNPPRALPSRDAVRIKKR